MDGGAGGGGAFIGANRQYQHTDTHIYYPLKALLFIVRRNFYIKATKKKLITIFIRDGEKNIYSTSRVTFIFSLLRSEERIKKTKMVKKKTFYK